MLLNLEIKNLAVVEAVSLSFERGLSAITGETGAGKSIIVDALGLLSGLRSDSSIVRSGQMRAEVTGEFAPGADALQWLREADLDEDTTCLLKRVIRREGPSKAFINGRPVSASQLAELAQRLFEIHGQNEHQSLLIRQAQLRSIDELGGHLPSLQALAALSTRALTIEAELAEFGNQDIAELADFLRFQIDELASLEPTDSALEQLNGKLKRLAASHTLRASAARTAEALGQGEHAMLRDLSRMQQEFVRLAELEPAFKDLPELLNQAKLNLDEAAGVLRHYLSEPERDPREQQLLEDKLDRWHELARKHRVSASELGTRLSQLRERLSELNANHQRIGTLREELKALEISYSVAAERLSGERAQTAARLSVRVRELLGELRMQQAQFSVALDRDPGRRFDPQGIDRAEFMVNFNLSQELRPLRKVASGGELSRMSLCLRLAAIESISVPTVIFDEVDAGVGGAVAESIGRLLRRLGESRQVFTVTHLAQVAALAHQQLQVSKSAQDGKTATQVQVLETDARVEEIARMIGGAQLTKATREHAREMLANN